MFKRSGSVVMIGVVLATAAVVLALGSSLSSGNSTSPNDHNININVTSGNVSSAVPPEVIKQLIYKDSTDDEGDEGDGKLPPQVLDREAQKDYDDIKGKILGWSQKHFWVIILIAIIVVLCIGALCLCLLCKK